MQYKWLDNIKYYHGNHIKIYTGPSYKLSFSEKERVIDKTFSLKGRVIKIFIISIAGNSVCSLWCFDDKTCITFYEDEDNEYSEIFLKIINENNNAIQMVG